MAVDLVSSTFNEDLRPRPGHKHWPLSCVRRGIFRHDNKFLNVSTQGVSSQFGLAICASATRNVDDQRERPHKF